MQRSLYRSFSLTEPSVVLSLRHWGSLRFSSTAFSIHCGWVRVKRLLCTKRNHIQVVGVTGSLLIFHLSGSVIKKEAPPWRKFQLQFKSVFSSSIPSGLNGCLHICFRWWADIYLSIHPLSITAYFMQGRVGGEAEYTLYKLPVALDKQGRAALS